MSERLIRHRIFDELRQDILSCGLPPGEEIREGELARRFGVSKSPIRDALQKLEFEGLVEISPRRGHRVAPISVTDAAEILEMREMLEAGALRKLAAEGTPETLARLDALRQADTSSLEAFSSYNRHFHVTLCELSGNRRLCETMERLMENYDRLCVVSLSVRRTEREAMEAALADHNAIIDAVQARSGATAVRLSARHTKRSRSQIMRALDSRPIVG